MPYKFMNSSIFDPHIRYMSSLIIKPFTWFYKKGNLSPQFYRAQMQLKNFSNFKIIHTPGNKLSVADMLGRSFTKAELQINQMKHKQLPPQIDVAI